MKHEALEASSPKPADRRCELANVGTQDLFNILRGGGSDQLFLNEGIAGTKVPALLVTAIVARL